MGSRVSLGKGNTDHEGMMWELYTQGDMVVSINRRHPK